MLTLTQDMYKAAHNNHYIHLSILNIPHDNSKNQNPPILVSYPAYRTDI